MMSPRLEGAGGEPGASPGFSIKAGVGEAEHPAVAIRMVASDRIAMRRIRSYLPPPDPLLEGVGDPDGLLVRQVSGHVENHSPVRVGQIHHQGLVHQAGLYAKSRKAMYAIALAPEGFSLSAADPDIQELPVALYHPLADSLVYAA